MLRDGSSEVWPQQAEAIFLDGLREYWNSPWANFSRGRSRWRNQFLVDYLKKAGIERTKKQVASHIQVLRNMWKGHPEFCLVAGPEELNADNVGSSPPSDGQPSRRRMSTSHASTSSRKSPTASSPPSTPLSYDSESASDASPHMGSRRDTIRPGSLVLGSPLTLHIPSSIPEPLKSELSPKIHHPYDHPALASISDMRLDPPQDLHLLNLTRVCGLGLWTDAMEPIYIDVDTLPAAMAPTALAHPTSPTQQQPPIVRTSLRVKLGMPSAIDGIPDTLRGFNGAVSFTTPVPASAKCLTKVHVDGACISREFADFIPVAPPPPPDHVDQAEQKFVALLPDSWLSRCRWLDTGSKKTLVTQQVIVDSETLFVVIYDLHRVKHTVPTAELVLWHKQIDPAVLSPSPTSTQFLHHPAHSQSHASHPYASIDPSQQQHHHQQGHAHTPPSQMQSFSNAPPPPDSPASSNSSRGCSASQSMFTTSIDPWATSLLPLF